MQRGVTGLAVVAAVIGLTTGAAAQPDAARARAPQRLEAVATEPRITHFGVVVDAALVPLGKIGARFEAAITPMHALYVEPSYLVRRIDAIDRTVTGTEMDVGYHLFPQARGIRGFYFGPRAIFAGASTEDASGYLWGFGGDLGYQWALRGGPAINIGAGVAYYHLTARPQVGSMTALAFLDPVHQAAITGATANAWGLMPLGMAGFGLAY
jgi:hypothetical protein